MSAQPQNALVLAIDDDADVLFSVQASLEASDFEVVTTQDPAGAIALAESRKPNAIICDVQMPKLTGLELAKRFKNHATLRFIPFVLLTAQHELDDVLAGFEAGADDYIKKPFAPAELVARVQAALRLRKTLLTLETTQTKNRELQAALSTTSKVEGLIGQSPEIEQIKNLIHRFKDSDLPVLISGESGSGKELVARALHFESSRSAGPFVVQNCAVLGADLLESELFGHVKGSFSGAVRDKEGLFEVADGGTFFLDEMGELKPALQAKLLRVLQEGTFIPVGGTVEKKVTVRIVAATNRQLRAMVEQGIFREDLFYRLHVLNIAMPPLRNRRSDIPLITHEILRRREVRLGKKSASISKDALTLLEAREWPGNIRELINEIERAALLAGEGNTLSVDHFSTAPDAVSQPAYVKSAASDSLAETESLAAALAKLEKEIILKALSASGGNKSETSRKLGISRSNLIAKAKEYGIDSDS